MIFDLPRGEIFEVREIDVRLDPGPHPFAVTYADAIAENWLRELKAQPALYDGEVALLSSLVWRAGRLSGRCHIVPYSAFMYWRTLRPYPTAEHTYAHAIPVTRDNALVAIRMSSTTVGAGLAYFAAGSFEPRDFVGGRVDVAANMVREVREEAGLDLTDVRHDPTFHGLSLPTGTVLFRRYYVDDDADDLAARIDRFVHAEGDPEGEIDGPVIIRGGTDLPPDLASQMPALIRWHFGT